VRLATDSLSIRAMTFAVAFMNLQLHHVVSDVSGATGLRLVCAIIACAHNVKVLAAIRDFRCKMQVCAATQALASTTRPAGASCGTLCLRPTAVWRSGMTGDAIKSARARRRPIAVGHDARFDAEKPSFGRLNSLNRPDAVTVRLKCDGSRHRNLSLRAAPMPAARPGFKWGHRPR
jgi:hypothetical protein